MRIRNCLHFRSIRVFVSAFSGVRVARSLVFSVIFCRSLFVLFIFAIVLSVLLQFTDSDYPIWYMLTYFVKKKINNTSVSTFNHAILKFRICIILVPVLDNIYDARSRLRMHCISLNSSVSDKKYCNWKRLSTLASNVIALRSLENIITPCTC